MLLHGTELTGDQTQIEDRTLFDDSVDILLEQLNYRNLLAAFHGRRRQAVGVFGLCDTRKGDGNLRWNPAKSR